MFFETQDGETIYMKAVIMVENSVGSNGSQCYNIHLSGGQHITLKENFKSRSEFITEWKGLLNA